MPHPGPSRSTGSTLTALAAEFGTPLYVVDENDARTRAARLKAAFDDAFAAVGGTVKVYYAGKAFLSTEIARWMTAAGLNIDVCSSGELAVALAAGVDPSRLGFHGNNKSRAEIDRSVALGVGAIVLDSVVELDRVAEAARAAGVVQAVRLRINSGVHASTHEYLATAREDQKFGIPLAEAPDVVAQIRARDSLRFLGLHSHIGSQIFESDGFAEAARRLLVVHAVLLDGGEVPELNLGGGFGIAYTSADVVTPIERIAEDFARVVSSECAALGIPVPVVAIEPGRAIIGPSTVTLYEVGTTKPVEVSTGSTHRDPSVRLGRRRHERQHPAGAVRRGLLGADREPGLGCRPGSGAHRRQALRERRHRRARRLPARGRHPRRPRRRARDRRVLLVAREQLQLPRPARCRRRPGRQRPASSCAARPRKIY